MKILSLYDLVKENTQKNNELIISVTELTKQKINKYYYSKRPFNFTNYSKIIDKLDDINLYYEIESSDGFNLLEFNGVRFKCIEFEGDNNMNSLKKFQSLDELNSNFQTWIANRYKFKTEVKNKADELEIRLLKLLKKKQKQQIKDNEKEIEK